jgi:hypothetical protein
MISKLSKLFLKLSKFKHFDKNHLNSLETLKEKYEYLNNLFPIIGKSHRIVFAISPKKAIKLVNFVNPNISKVGFQQNKMEAYNLTRAQSLYLPKIYDHSNDYSWIEVELVRPLRNRNEFFELTNMRFDHFCDLIKNNSIFSDNKIIQEILDLCFKLQLDPFEFCYLENLGKSSSGNIVLLDAGWANR